MPSSERLNRLRWPSGLEKFPILPKLLLMKLCPCLDEPPLPQRKKSRNEFNGVDCEHRNCFLVIDMKVRCLVGTAGLRKHPDDNAEEAGYFRHSQPPLREKMPISTSIWSARTRRESIDIPVGCWAVASLVSMRLGDWLVSQFVARGLSVGQSLGSQHSSLGARRSELGSRLALRAYVFILGSSTSRRPSPARFRPSTVIAMARPGKMVIQEAVCM